MLLAAALAALAAVPDASPAVHRLDNGLVVVLEEQHRTDRVALFVRVDVGSRDERDGERGCAHLFEHLMFEGSAHVPNEAFDAWLAAAGGSNNAWTSEDETVYHMVFPRGALDLALFLESDRLGFLEAGLDERNLANQREVVLREREQGYAAPHGRDFDALSPLLWPEGHPYRVPVIGTADDVRGVSLDTVRAFRARHYLPSRATLVLVGDFDAEEALERVRHWFSDVPAAPTEPRAAEVAAFEPLRAHGLLHDRVEDRTVHLAWPTVPRGHADEAALDVLSWLLDGGRGTRLYDALYDKGVATEVGAFSWTGDLGGAFVVSATSPRVPLPRLVARVDAVLARLARNPPAADEVDRARGVLRADLLDRLERPEDRAELFLECLARHGRPDCVADRLAALDAVTPDDVSRVVRTWLDPARRSTLSVVPEGDDGALPGAVPVELP